MASKKKKHAAAVSDEKPRKKRKRKASKRKAKASSSGAPKKKRGRKPLQLLLRVEDTPINSPALSKLSDGQRVDLAAMSSKRSFSTRPAWATNEQTWRKSIRLVSPQWKRLSNPWATVARVYILLDGSIGHGRGHVEREREQPKQRGRRSSSNASARQAEPEDDGGRVHVERVNVDEAGVDDEGHYRGRGIWWRVWDASIDSVVRAATAAAARAIVMGRG